MEIPSAGKGGSGKTTVAATIQGETGVIAGADEFDDRTVGRLVRVGVVIGVPIAFVVVAVAVLLAGAGLSTAVEIAAWPAVVAGPYVGAIAALNAAEAGHHRPAAKVLAHPTAVSKSTAARRAA